MLLPGLTWTIPSKLITILFSCFEFESGFRGAHCREQAGPCTLFMELSSRPGQRTAVEPQQESHPQQPPLPKYCSPLNVIGLLMHGPSAVEPAAHIHHGMFIQGNLTRVQIVVMLQENGAMHIMQHTACYAIGYRCTYAPPRLTNLDCTKLYTPNEDLYGIWNYRRYFILFATDVHMRVHVVGLSVRV